MTDSQAWSLFVMLAVVLGAFAFFAAVSADAIDSGALRRLRGWVERWGARLDRAARMGEERDEDRAVEQLLTRARVPWPESKLRPYPPMTKDEMPYPPIYDPHRVPRLTQGDGTTCQRCRVVYYRTAVGATRTCPACGLIGK